MSTYTPNDAAGIPATYSAPDDGNPRTASSVLVFLEAIADAVAWISRRRLKRVNDLTALAALTGMQDKDRAFVDFDGRGWYSFVLGASVSFNDGLWAVPATDGTGVWIGDGLKRYPSRERLVATPGADFSTTSTTYVDATGWSVSSIGIAGDHLEMRFSGPIVAVTGAANRTAQLVVTDPSGTTTLTPTVRASNASTPNLAGYDVAADYVLGGTGAYTVKLQIATTGADTARVIAGSMLSVVRYKP